MRKGSNGKYEHNKYVTDNAHFIRFASKNRTENCINSQFGKQQKINGRYTYRESELSFPNGKLQAQQYQSMNDSKAKSSWFSQHDEQR